MDGKQTIAVAVNDIAREFLAFARVLESEENFAAQIPSTAVQDEFARFKLWAGNIAAHLRGRRSLEYRLRDAGHLKLEVHNLLKDVSDALSTSISIVKGERTPWDQQDLSDSESDSASDDIATLLGDTELKQLFEKAKSTITSLFRLSMAIRNPAPNTQSKSYLNVDKSIYEPHDILHVQAKYPSSPAFLTERLGRAISARRQYLSYREQHHSKLEKNIEKLGIEDSHTEHTENSTEATPLPSAESWNGPSILEEDDSASQTSFATSINATIRVPPLPREAKGQDYFECPLCFMIVSIQSQSAWKQHVYRDLRPYCCTFEDCATADRLYETRHEWFQHELEAHRTTWECIEGCGELFVQKPDLEKHIQRCHPKISSISSLIIKSAARASELSQEVTCSLCDAKLSLGSLKTHLASHQQQLALFALPPNLDETDDDYDQEERVSDDEGDEDDSELYDGGGDISSTIVKISEDNVVALEHDLDRPSSSPSPSPSPPPSPPPGSSRRETEDLIIQQQEELPDEHKMSQESAVRSEDGHKATPLRGILRKPKPKFPEEDEFIREGVAPHKDAIKGPDFPVNARWTRIDRRLVNPEALEEAKERFEERTDCVIVLRVLTKHEIQKLADRTNEIRAQRELEDKLQADKLSHARGRYDRGRRDEREHKPIVRQGRAGSLDRGTAPPSQSHPLYEQGSRGVVEDVLTGRNTYQKNYLDEARRTITEDDEPLNAYDDRARTTHKPPEVDDYSYTSPEDMYRDTEPSWRRGRELRPVRGPRPTIYQFEKLGSPTAGSNLDNTSQSQLPAEKTNETGVDWDDKNPERETDVLVFKEKRTHYPTHFPAHSIRDGDLKIGTVRQAVAKKLGITDSRRIHMSVKGRDLKHDGRSARDEGLRGDGTGSEILVTVGEAPGGGEESPSRHSSMDTTRQMPKFQAGDFVRMSDIKNGKAVTATYQVQLRRHHVSSGHFEYTLIDPDSGATYRNGWWVGEENLRK